MTPASVTAVAVLFCAAAPAAAAQSAQTSASHVVAPPQNLRALTEAPVQPLSAAPERGPRIPQVTLFGVPVHVWAPQPAPYENYAYRTLGGQPETGGDAVLAESMTGE